MKPQTQSSDAQSLILRETMDDEPTSIEHPGLDETLWSEAPQELLQVVNVLEILPATVGRFQGSLSQTEIVPRFSGHQG